MKSLSKPFATILIALFVAIPLQAQTKNADPTGTWRWDSEDQSGEIMDNALTVSVSKGKAMGVFNGWDGRFKDLKSVAGTIKGDQLVLDFEVETPEMDFEAKYEGTIKGDTATGTITLSSDQGSMDLPWKAKRSVEMSDVVGEWDLVVETDGEEHDLKLNIDKKGGKYVAKMKGDEIGECVVKDMKTKGTSFMFTTTGVLQGMDFVAKFETKPRGHKLEGELELEIANDSMSLPVEGRRKPKSDLTSLVGTWDLLLEAPDQDHEIKLIVKDKGGKISAVATGDAGDFPAKNMKMKNGKLHFNIEGDIQGQDFEALCVLKVMGKELKGDMLLEMGGEEMELPLSGELAK